MTKDKLIAGHRVKLWDISTRLFHWVLVVLFCLSAYSAFQDKFGIYADIHLWSGFSILVLVCWRIVWGFVGSETSRFSQFIKSPKAALAYLQGQQTAGLGHNPLGGYSVLLMLVLLLAQATLGLFASDGMFFGGPLEAGDAYKSWVNNTHEMLGYTLFGLVGLHLVIVLFYWVVRKANLILPMITGWTASDKPAPVMRSAFLAFTIAVSIAGILYLLIF